MRKFVVIRLFFILSLAVLMGCIISSANSHAADTKKSITAEIKKLNKEIMTLSKKEKKQKEGTTAISGSVISSNPCVIKSNFSFSGAEYYWVKNPQNLTILFTSASGYVTKSNKYKYYNGIPCNIVTAKKINYNYSRSLEKKRRKLKILKNTLNYKPSLSTSKSLTIGEKEQLSYGKSKAGKNKVKWKSSNTAVVSVSSAGVVTAKKAGTATITAKASISGKSGKCKIKVVAPYIKFEKNNYTFDIKNMDWSSYILLPQAILLSFKVDSNITYIDADITSSNPEVLDPCSSNHYDDKYGTINKVDVRLIPKVGTYTVTVTDRKSQINGKCTVTIVDTRQVEFENDNYTFDLKDGDYVELFLNAEFWQTYDVVVSDSSIVRVYSYSDNRIAFSLTGKTGTCDITAIDKVGKEVKCTVTVTNTNSNNDYNDYDDYDDDYDDYDYNDY